MDGAPLVSSFKVKTAVDGNISTWEKLRQIWERYTGKLLQLLKFLHTLIRVTGPCLHKIVPMDVTCLVAFH